MFSPPEFKTMATSFLAVGLVAFVLATVVLAEITPSKSVPLFQQSVADHINSLNPGWTAGFNERIHSLKHEEYKNLLGTFRGNPGENGVPILPPWKIHKHPVYANLPKEFDARKKWPHCKTISTIRDQGHCGSCWAFGAVEALTDRFCVQGNESVALSANDLVACCGFLCGMGCSGGWPYKAWRYFIRKGVVTDACQPYFDQEGCQHPGCSPGLPTPKCTKTCSNNEGWEESKHYAKDAYVVGPDQEEIKAELFLNGPVEVDYNVYEDFVYYTGGVYKHVYGEFAGGHAVKLIGWGTTPEGVDYWLIANSWNKSWGEDGYFRIVRGVNECGIEADVTAGTPLLKLKAKQAERLTALVQEA
eukprot:TRINITY_DN38636_c0_g1_i1.p1 TRINITY_DN38636_c0_g1~~TRINITY_DN38636_c0_g1_i1.p1  ORF type:complete len:360 (+),score=54.34 TRINITY_DN38636_c0_g1_i1:65-1144(+)